jgi:hypothetical protein
MLTSIEKSGVSEQLVRKQQPKMDITATLITLAEILSSL